MAAVAASLRSEVRDDEWSGPAGLKSFTGQNGGLGRRGNKTKRKGKGQLGQNRFWGIVKNFKFKPRFCVLNQRV
jgi:hypothetical protein